GIALLLHDDFLDGGKSRRLDQTVLQGVDPRRAIARVQDSVVLVAKQAFACQSPHLAKLIASARSGYAHHLSFQVAESGNALGANKNLVDVSGMAADNHNIGSSLNTGDRGHTGDHGEIGVAAK